MKTDPGFFLLEEPQAGSSKDREGGTRAVDTDDKERGDAPRCGACGCFLGLLTWLPPYRVELETYGKEYGDIMRIGDDLVVSTRFRRLYESNDLRGLTGFEPVEVVKLRHRRKRLGASPTYFKATIMRVQTTVDHEASGKQWAPECMLGGDLENQEWPLGELLCAVCLNRKGIFVRQKRLVIQPGTWTGEDIFHARGGATFVVTERFKDVCETHGVKNVVFIPAEDYEVDYYPSESRCLRKYLRTLEDHDYNREMRQDAYRALECGMGRNVTPPQIDFDPDKHIDRTLVESVRKRLQREGLL